MSANIQASVVPLVQPGTKSPLQLISDESIRGKNPQLAQDLVNIANTINKLHKTIQQSPQITQLLLVNATGQVVAALGPVIYQGVQYSTYFSEAHIGNPDASTNPSDPANAIFNANTDGSVSIGNSGFLDIHDEFDGNAAWIGTQNDTLVITGAVNNGAGEVRLTVVGHTLATGNTAAVRFMNLYGVENANGTWVVTVIDANTVDLNGSIICGPYTPLANPPAGIHTYDATIDRVLQITGATNSAGLIELQTSIPHAYETGDRVNVPTVPGVPAATGQWTITVVDPTHFTLDGSTFAGGFTSNGTCLRYFAGILAQTIAIGPSFENYNLRGFADGTLRIRNASIVLTAGTSTITLDPTVPSIDLKSPTSEITLNAATGQITLAKIGNAAKIVLDATVPNIKLYDSTGTLSVTIDSNGTITAQTVNSTTGVTAAIVIGGLTLNFNQGVLTSQSGAFSFPGGFTGNVTGVLPTSVFTFANGLLSSFTP